MKNKGFTLVELVMAIAIFSIAAYALITVFTIVAPKDINANVLTVGSHLMNRKMEEVTLHAFPINSFPTAPFGPPFDNYFSEVIAQYVTAAEPDIVSGVATDYQRIKVRVWGPNLGTIESVTIVATYEI
ncbi:MAG: type II secretion system protein [Candidatus Margulisiibacteriota bacterium]